MKKVYLSGPVSGTKDYVDRFVKMEILIRRNFYDLDVVNPVRVMAQMPESDYKQYIKLSLQLLDDCDYICILNGAENSKGAQLEAAYAQCMGIEIIYEEDFRSCLNQLCSQH